VSPEESLRGADPVLGAVIDEVPPVAMDAWRARWAPGDRFGLLARVIVGQQISARAATAIFARLRDLMGRDAPAAAVAAASDEEVVAQLVAVRGIGPWTADLFLLGALGRPDVLPAGDLRLRSVVRAAYGLEATPSEREVRELGRRWRPHCSLATAYLYSWRRDSAGGRLGTSTP
jgi:DNA-3-methyladenine glycosylase II